MLQSSANGHISSIEIPSQQLIFQNHQQLILGRRNNTNHYGNHFNLIIHQNKQFIHERRNLVIRKRNIILPLAIREEDHFTNYDDEEEDGDFSSFFSDFSRQLNAFYRLSHPHTVYGTLIGVTSVSLLPIASLGDLSLDFFLGLIKALVPSIFMNIYVVGLNQLYDFQIDKVNKPDLPLASGEFTIGTGSTIVSLSCLLKYVLGRGVMLTRSVIFTTAFMCFFATVIALFKDIPDADGDKHFGIQSFTVTLGKEMVFWLCIKMLLAAYGAATVLGASSPSLPAKLITVFGHSTLALVLWSRAQSVNLADKLSITSFYMFIWKLFYAEYFLVPFIR